MADKTPKQLVLAKWSDATCERDEDGFRVWHGFAFPDNPSLKHVSGRSSGHAFKTEAEAWANAAAGLKGKRNE